MMAGRSLRVVWVLGLALATGEAILAQRSSAPPAAPAQGRAPAAAAGRVTSPKEQWGHNVGDDYFLANYQQTLAYWRVIEKQSPRLRIVDIGRTAENRQMVMAILTAPANFAKLD